jgi:hypothetical protein
MLDALELKGDAGGAVFGRIGTGRDGDGHDTKLYLHYKVYYLDQHGYSEIYQGIFKEKFFFSIRKYMLFLK